ncbi:MAG TPA: hypothetical protein VIH99_01955 [Bdellovibrionota bacterium]|jgi:hypothetical protein
MRIIPIRKFFGAIRSSFPKFRNQRGQGFLEYTLVILVVLGVLFVAARPVIAKLQKTFEKGLKQGFFKEDPTGGNFYYFPLK